MSSMLDYVGVQNESPQIVPLWCEDCFELKANLTTISRETSVRLLTIVELELEALPIIRDGQK